jgi:hypothetical protein
MPTANALDPDRTTVEDRLSEVAALLALGLMRLRHQKSSELSTDAGESSLHFSARKSVHAPHEGGERCGD